PTYARRAFPSFDEPNFKAVFSISINRPADYNSLGNTNATTDGDKDTFGDTPIMSTYLVAFIVSKFQGYGSQLEGERQRYDVWCREEALTTAKYAYDVGPKLLDALNNYTDIDYYSMEGVEKMDQVAIPDFSAGAMENWGLVTYRETALLWDETESTSNNKQRVASVIAHEFAHMWWGNLVTLDWWQWTWLNEGFARYYQYYITSLVQQDWELMDQFVIEQQQTIFASDALESSAALNKEALTPNDISNKFASVSYNKGASVIRMAINFLGEKNFLDGIQEYLNTNSFSNTRPDQLYEALNNFAPDTLPEDLNVIMESWTENAGYPVVTVSRNESVITLKQERFLLNSAATSNFKYYVPITYTTQENSNFGNTTVTRWLLPTADLNIELEEESTGWIIVNLLETGYYRVNYDDELWDALKEALLSDNFGDIPVINRAQIVDDILNLARADKINYTRALDVTTFLENEQSYYPWYAAFNAFAFLRRRIGTSDIGDMLQTHILTMMANLYNSINFNIPATTSHVNILKSALTLQWACELEHENCIGNATETFGKFFEDGEAINPNIRTTVYCSAVRQEEAREYWDFLWNRYNSTKLATEQVIILSALGCSKDEEILKEYLALSISSESGIRKQDAGSVFTAVLAGNPGNVDIAFTFLQENVEELVNYYEGMSALDTVINGIADRLTTKEQIDLFAEFIEDNRDILKSAANTGTTAIETARANLQWVESNSEELGDWLNDIYGSAASVTLSFTVLLVG
ncbi:Peptidase, partial [Oryctes borbonicus]